MKLTVDPFIKIICHLDNDLLFSPVFTILLSFKGRKLNYITTGAKLIISFQVLLNVVVKYYLIVSLPEDEFLCSSF